MLLSSETCFLHLSPPAGRGRIASAIRVRGSIRERGGDGFENARHVAQHVVVPEAQYAIVAIDKPFVANSVAGAVCVLTAVHFHNQATFATDKIYGVRPDGLLSDELVSTQPTGAKTIPERPFRVCRNVSQPPRTPCLELISTTHVEAPPHPDCFAIRPLPASGERLAPNTVT